MGVFHSLSTSASSMQNASHAIQVLGNNIANLGTPGFKRSRVVSSDAFSSILVGGNPGEQVGNGANGISVQRITTGGDVQQTGNPLDLSINGKGWFVVKDAVSNAQFYSRAGNLRIDKDLNLVHATGKRVQGFLIDKGVLSTTPSSITIPVAINSGKATTSIALNGLLDSKTQILGTASNFTSGTKNDEFRAVLGTNDQIVFRIGEGPAITASLVTDGGLTSGAPVSGAGLAAALKQALEAKNGNSDLYDITYDQKTDKFTILNRLTSQAGLTLLNEDPTSTASGLFGFVATPSGMIQPNASQSSDLPVAFNVVAGVNDTLSVTVDGVPATATIAAGNYAGKDLAFVLQKAIVANAPKLAGLKVTYNDNDAPGRFRILAPRTGGAHTIAQPSNTATPSIAVAASQVAVTGGSFLSTSGFATGTFTEGTGFFDAAKPFETSNTSAQMEVIDGLGQKHNMLLFFREVSENTWEWHATVDGQDLVGPTLDTFSEEVASGLLQFTSDGKLESETTTAGTGIFNFDATGSGPLPPQGQSITLDFGDAILTEGGTGEKGVNQFSSGSILNQGRNVFEKNLFTLTNLTTDGVPAGSFLEAIVDGDGFVTAKFSNGQSAVFAQLAIALFPAEGELRDAADTLFQETSLSGAPVVTIPGQNGAGDILPSSLEGSNIQLGEQFGDLIVQQGIFQANSRVITTSDRMLDSLINLT